MESLFDLDGRVAVVTGALGFLGKHHCRALARAGARVVVSDLDESAASAFADALCRQLRADAGCGVLEPVGIALDVTREQSVQDAMRRVEGRLGPVEILVNNAAINEKMEGSEQGPSSELDVEAFGRALAVGLTGAFACCKHFGEEMVRRRRGSIINIASTYGVVAPDQSLYRDPDGAQRMVKSAAYPAAKGGLLALTRHLACHWGGAGVRVNAISPGGVQNGQPSWFIGRYAARTPLGRMARPHDLAGALVFLASDASAYVTGANLIVDGGWTAW